MSDCSRRFPFVIAFLLAAGFGAGAETHASGVLGRYHDAQAVGKIKIRTDEGERVRRFSAEGGKVVVARKKIDVHFKDRDSGRKFKLKMKLHDRVKRADAQVVTISEGTLFIKDLETGEPLARGGQFSDTPFQLGRRDGTRFVRTERPLKIRRISGERPFDGSKISVRIRARRDQ